MKNLKKVSYFSENNGSLKLNVCLTSSSNLIEKMNTLKFAYQVNKNRLVQLLKKNILAT
jgi:hypothetical protein